MFRIIKVKKSLFLLLFLCMAIGMNAQLLSQKKVFTRMDSLRGSLREERNCFDVTFYNLSIDFDTLNKTISGRNAIYFNATSRSNKIQIDLAENLSIDQISYRNRPLTFTREFNAVFVSLPEPLVIHQKDSLVITYHGKPQIAKRAPWDGGFIWKHDINNNLWLAVACEGLGASAWWPCKDHLSDEPDSLQITCIIPQQLEAVCNGNWRGEKRMYGGKKAVTWFVSYPINLYNVTFNIGNYIHWNDTLKYSDGDILQLDYYVLANNKVKAEKQFEQVKPMLLCYEKYLGKYPFMKDGYALVETPYLGMEHQGAIAYGNKFKSGYDGRDYSRIGLDFDYIIIHETGHEWWGNSVSCADIGDMWIHEGFCTYTEAIYVECMFGKQKALEYINAKKTTIGNKSPMQGPYGVNEEGDGDMYNKGMLMLNSLRTIVNNDSLWWNTIYKMANQAFKFKTTNAEEVIRFFETSTALPLSPFFQQYLNYPEIPILNYKLNKKGRKTYIVEYHWTSNVPNFEMPVMLNVGPNIIRYKGTTQTQTQTLKLKKGEKVSVNEDLTYFKTLRLD
jgi:aminopeptidase N